MKIGDKFYKKTSEYTYLKHCKNCGRERNGEGWSADNNCANCGTSYSVSTRIVKPVYIIGIGIDYKDRTTLQLCETKPSELDGAGYTYWNTTADKLGLEFYKTKSQAEKDGLAF